MSPATGYITFGTGNRLHNALVTTVYDDLMHIEGHMSRNLVFAVAELTTSRFCLMNTLNLPRRAPHSTFLRLLAVQQIRYLPRVFGLNKKNSISLHNQSFLSSLLQAYLMKYAGFQDQRACASGHFPISTSEPV